MKKEFEKSAQDNMLNFCFQRRRRKSMIPQVNRSAKETARAVMERINYGAINLVTGGANAE